jgi:hypothetical protein
MLIRTSEKSGDPIWENQLLLNVFSWQKYRGLCCQSYFWQKMGELSEKLSLTLK